LPLGAPPAANVASCGLFKSAGVADAGTPSPASGVTRRAAAASTGKAIQLARTVCVCWAVHWPRARSTPSDFAGGPRTRSIHEPVGLQLPPPQLELLQRQAFLGAPVDRPRVALWALPHPLRPQPPFLTTSRPWHLSPRLRVLVILPARTQATNPVKNGDGVRLHELW